MPFTNSSWTYQDCEPISDDVTISFSETLDKCSTIRNSYTLRASACDEEKMFVCQRYEGDCWYEPFFEEEPEVFLAETSITIEDPNIQASACAVECRNFYDATTGSECWGFTFYPNTMCTLHVDDSPFASSNYLLSTKRRPGHEDSTFYVRRCFEECTSLSPPPLSLPLSPPLSLSVLELYKPEMALAPIDLLERTFGDR
ncbi:uncharacterized protein LOC128559670 [Mercenaria mercenaria]|uniref:uncharacterized protein LOC128559670 n=1 Tax=Mercenaria mercenaria TaxID=6596 RepID=UPI00234FA28A|nr:uncharacterized protein LOC128559670 [Mercenaria mercenaria]